MANSMKEAMERAMEGKEKVTAMAKVKKAKPKEEVVIRIPTIHRVETTAEKRETIDRAVEEAQQYIAAIPEHMAELVTRIRGIRGASTEEQTIRSKELKQLEDEVLVHLNSEEELLASAARQAYALVMVSTLPPDKRLVIETIEGRSSRLPGLLQLKILESVEPVGNAKNVVAVRVYGGTYKVNGGRDFALQVAEKLSEGAAKATKVLREQYLVAVAERKAQATISVVEFLAKKPGWAFIDVPDVNGEKFLPGGGLLVESDGETVKAIDACGHFQRIMTEIAEAEVSIPLEALGSERSEFKRRSPEDEFRCRVLHSVLRRGIAEAQKEAARQERIAEFQAQVDCERKELEKMATISAADWLLEDAIGTVVIYFGRSPWVITDRSTKREKPYFEVFFLVERNAEGEVRIVEYPERLESLFGNRFSEFVDPGERFGGLRYPLAAMLRHAYAFEERKADAEVEGARRNDLKIWAEKKRSVQPAEEK